MNRIVVALSFDSIEHILTIFMEVGENISVLQCLQEPFIRSLSSYHFHGSSSPFDRRITCLEWHPTHPTTLAAASKGGDIFLWDFTNPTNKTFFQGVSFCITFVFSDTYMTTQGV